MKTIKKILSISLILLLAFSVMLFTACDGDGATDDNGDNSGGSIPPCTIHTDRDANNVCDICQAELECEHYDGNEDGICDDCGEVCGTPVVKVDVAFSVKDEDGIGVKDITVSVILDGDTVFSGVTNADGKVTANLKEGTYTVSFDGLPENWYCPSENATFTVGAELEKNYDFTLIDNTPDGSAEKPYYLGEETTLDFPAGATFNVFTRGSTRYMIIEGADVKVTYNDTEYLPDGDGILKVLVHAPEDTNSQTAFTITNTSTEAISVTVTFEGLPGSSDNPYPAELDTLISQDIFDEEAVIYRYVAEHSGVLVLTSQAANNNIMLYNLTSLAATSFTDGGGTLYIKVTEGDEVNITVTAKNNANTTTTVDFTLKLYTGTDTDPIPVEEKAALATIGANSSLSFIWTADAADVKIDATGIEVTVDGAAVEADEYGIFTLTLSENSVFTIKNTTGAPISIILE